MLNLVDNLVPTNLKPLMQTTAISAAIKPYSIAVAPDSSCANLSDSFTSMVLMTARPDLRPPYTGPQQ